MHPRASHSLVGAEGRPTERSEWAHAHNAGTWSSNEMSFYPLPVLLTAPPASSSPLWGRDLFATASLDKTCRLWRCREGAGRDPGTGVLEGHTESVNCVAFMPGGGEDRDGVLSTRTRGIGCGV